jgi:hypothetical protein
MEIGNIPRRLATQPDTGNVQSDSIKSQTRSKSDSDTQAISPNEDKVQLRSRSLEGDQTGVEPITDDNMALFLSQQAGQSLDGLIDGITGQMGKDVLREL